MRGGWLVFVIACGARAPVEPVDKIDDIDALLRIIKDDDGAAAERAWIRLGTFSNERVRPKLFALFDARKWKVRWVAAALYLRMSTTKDIAEFMRHLPTRADQPLGLAEWTTYGTLIGRMDAPAGEPTARDVAIANLRSPTLGAKLTALGYFYEGKRTDITIMQASEADTTPIPRCNPNDECGWSCEEKSITTVGEFVKLCIEPTMTND